jgi:hypothetical protein
MGVYASTASGGKVGPAGLVVDAGTASTATTGYKEVATTQSLTGDTLYWLAALFEAAPSVTVNSGTTNMGGRRTTGGTLSLASYYETVAYGALPSNANSLASLFVPESNTDSPILWVKL